MKYRSFMLLLVAVVFLAGCGTKEATEDAKKADEVVNQQVEDYTDLSQQELEVMAYDGDVDAQIELANRYDYGTAEAGRDFEKAKQWYELAASSGSGEAMCALGYFHLNGLATDVDMEQAASYFQQAIDVGNDHGYVGLGRTYLAGYGEEETRGEQAYLNIKTAYDKELPGGIYYLAYLTELGIGTEENDQEAMTLYRQVTELEELSLYDGYLPDAAWTRLGLMYVDAKGVEQDYEEAMACFEHAANDGYAMAQYYLGQMYENGLGMDQNYEEAFSWYVKAADQDYAPALNQIGYLYYNGYGVENDIDQAIYYQKLAAMQGYSIAQINLGYLFENGIGVEQNYGTALAYYQRAADQNNEGAREAVARVLKRMNEEK